VATRLLKLDYLGITLTISTTAISATCLGLVNHPTARAFYVSLQLLCASAVSAVMMSPDMDGTGAAFWR
jgi:adiponectin receptor